MMLGLAPRAHGAARADAARADAARADAARALVERVSFAPRSDGQGYVIRVHARGRIAAYSEPHVEEGRLEWTIFNADVGSGYDAEGAEGPVMSYAAQAQAGHLVLRFDLREDVQVNAAAYRDRASDDLLLSLTYAADGVPALPTPAPPVANASERGAGAEGGSYSSGERWRLDTIVLDAGHGGKDPGTVGNGLQEKHIALSIVKKLGGYIENRLGVNVVYTRTTDRFVELRERGRIANEAGGKLFVSVHVNAAANHAAHGTETFFLGMHRSETARKVMERENSVIRYEDNPEQYEDLDDQALIMQTLAQSAYMRQSEALAGSVEHQFAERVGRESRGVKQAGFLVLWAASMPAILVETGFITNDADAAFLASERGQDYLASAIFRAVREFKQQYEKGLHLSSSRE